MYGRAIDVLDVPCPMGEWSISVPRYKIGSLKLDIVQSLFVRDPPSATHPLPLSRPYLIQFDPVVRFPFLFQVPNLPNSIDICIGKRLDLDTPYKLHTFYSISNHNNNQQCLQRTPQSSLPPTPCLPPPTATLTDLPLQTS